MENQLYQELQDILGDSIEYDAYSMFPQTEGFSNKRRIKKLFKSMRHIVPALPSVLLEDEVILYATRGSIISNSEQLFGGALAAQLANQTFIIATSWRLILINISSKGKQRLYRNQVLYSQIKKTGLSGFIGSSISLRRGQTIRFSGLPRKDCKNLDELILNHMPYKNAVAEQVRSPQYLCPHCSVVYSSIAKTCHVCGASYKSPTKASLFSLILPGLGDMYLGHTFFGCIELAGSLLIWFSLLMALLTPEQTAGQNSEAIIIFTAVLIVTHVIDALLTQTMAKKGLISATDPINISSRTYVP